MSFDDEGKKKQSKLLVKTMGILMALGFIFLAVFFEKLGPMIGFSQSLANSSMIKYLFLAVGFTDIIVFTFIFK